MNRFWEKVFYLATYITQGPSFLNPKAYASLHLRHHQHSDTEKDPHSPMHSPNIWKMMLSTYEEYKQALVARGPLHCPSWSWIDKLGQSQLNTLLWILIYPSVYLILEVEAIYYLLLPLHFLVGPTQGAIVNWFGHKLGYRNYPLNDHSKNSLPIDFLLMGELYQNNHHKNAKRLNFAHRIFEIDITYLIAKVLLELGIIHNKGAECETSIDTHLHHI